MGSALVHATQDMVYYQLCKVIMLHEMDTEPQKIFPAFCVLLVFIWPVFLLKMVLRK